jgi:hypothetical protein
LSAYEATTGENPLVYQDYGNCYYFHLPSRGRRSSRQRTLM